MRYSLTHRYSRRLDEASNREYNALLEFIKNLYTSEFDFLLIGHKERESGEVICEGNISKCVREAKKQINDWDWLSIEMEAVNTGDLFPCLEIHENKLWVTFTDSD